MSFREYLEKQKVRGNVSIISKPASKRLEISGLLKALEPRTVLVETVKESRFKVAGNVFPTKQSIADYLNCNSNQLIPVISKAIENKRKPEETKKAPCQEVVMDKVDLDELPILFHCPNDGGNYISSGVFIATDSQFGQNVDFHRCMQISKNKFTVRVVKDRHFDQFLKRQGEMPVAICVGNGANVLVAAATSVDIGVNELEIANALKPFQVAKAKTFEGFVPAESEFVLEGIIREKDRFDEGPFVDLTETQDVVRQEPVLEIKKITHRKDAIWQALLPGCLEHKVLMGMPREPTIFKKVNEQGVECLDVNVNPGGCSWLHAVVKINKKNSDDGKKAIAGAFEGHKSCKHVFVVDSDIDIYNPLEVEWAMATRFQADVDLIVKGKEKGSSLDPSSEPDTHLTTKCGFDLTKPVVVAKGKNFEKVAFPKVKPEKFV